MDMEIQVRDNHGALTFFAGDSFNDAVDFALNNNGWKISVNKHRFVAYVVGEILETYTEEDIKKYFPGIIPRYGKKMYDVYWRDEPLDPDLINTQTRKFQWETPFITTLTLRATLSDITNA